MVEKYRVSIVQGIENITPALRFRQKLFRNGKPGLDIDKFDEKCHHFLLYDLDNEELVCVFRALVIEDGIKINDSYSAQFYDLKSLAKCNGKMLEIGRFCMGKKNNDPTILMVAWSNLVKFISGKNIQTIFGCSSFEGVDKYKHTQAFSLLKEKHLTSLEIRPITSPECVFEYAKDLAFHQTDVELATLRLPPLLRFYLKIGAKVSEVAILDFDLQTMHVFTLLNLTQSLKFFR